MAHFKKVIAFIIVILSIYQIQVSFINLIIRSSKIQNNKKIEILTTVQEKFSTFSYTEHILPKCEDGGSAKKIGKLKITAISMTFDEIVKNLSSQNIEHGGKWSPKNCTAQHHVAILIPFHNREMHLRQFLFHIHPILARQELSYGIYVIEPVGNITFNRGLLFNAGFIESNKESGNKWQCHAYHDVDLLPEDDRTLFSCPQNPSQLSRFINFPFDADWKKNRYSWVSHVGGASIIKKDQFIKSNGYSNLFFGWGGEDDDYYERLIRFYNVTSTKYNKYTMLFHGPDIHNPRNPDRHKQLEKGPKRHNKVGLNSVKYELKSVEMTPLYTKFRIYYNQTAVLNEEDV